MTYYDHIVVGGGTAGCVISARLAEEGKRVALIETGPSDENNDLIKDLTQWSKLLGTELDYDYKIEEQARGNGNIRYSRGKFLSGCSGHNSCIAFETPDYDLREWVKCGAIGWDPDSVKPFLKKVREQVNFETAETDNKFVGDFLKACNEANLSTIKFNTGMGNEQCGVGWFDLNKKGIIRQSASIAYLHPLSQWKYKIDFYLNTKAYKILFRDNRAVGVMTSRGTIYTSGEIIICCGAIDTPKLLLLSGIGPKEHLRDKNVDLIFDLPGVGEHLLDHPEGVINWELNGIMPYEFINYWEVGIFDKVEEKSDVPDLMMHLGIVVFDMNTKLKGYPTAENGFCLTPNVTRAVSQGTVKLRSNNPNDNPLIDFKYFTDKNGYDEKIMVAGFKKAREIAAQPSLKKYIKRELTPGINIQTDEDISSYIRSTSNTVYHAAGTCKMGPTTDKFSVVDPELQVYGIENLRIADASIFPTMIGVNPNITIMMIGERCADFIIKSDIKKRKIPKARL